MREAARGRDETRRQAVQHGLEVLALQA